MNTAGLLIANLERLLSSPTSAETIRKLIFDLAIRGQLTTQSDKDEPASVLIAKVIRTAQAEDRRFSAEPAVTERPFELPSGWEWVRLGNTGKIFNGTSASAGEKVRLSKTTEGLPFIATKDVGYGRDPLCYENGLKVPHGDKDYKVARSGAVLICAEGGSAGKKVGQTNRSICFGNKLYANETWAGIESGYILSVYQSNFFYGEFKAKMAGIIGGIARSDFRSLRIPLPPLAEQKRIVAKVDELMALCDRLEAQLKERDVKQSALAKAALARFTEDPTPENLQLLFHPSFSISPSELRQSILNLAITGRLAPQEASVEGPGTMLKDLYNLKVSLCREGKLRASKIPAEPFLKKQLPMIPSSWRTVTFDHVASAQNNALKAGPFGSALKKEFYVKEGYKIYGQEQVIAGDASIGDYYIDAKKFQELESCAVSPGDILISLVGTIGKILVLPEKIQPGIINPRVIKLNLDKTLVYPSYIKVVIMSSHAVNFFEENSHGGTMNILNLSILRSLPIPLPSLFEQRKIVKRVEELMDLVNRLESQLEASRTTGEKLLEAMVAELTSA